MEKVHIVYQIKTYVSSSEGNAVSASLQKIY